MGFWGHRLRAPLASQLGESSDTIQKRLAGRCGGDAVRTGIQGRRPGISEPDLWDATNPATTAAPVGAGYRIRVSCTITDGAGISTRRYWREAFFRCFSVIVWVRLRRRSVGSSGIGASKAASLLTMAAPLVLGGLSRFFARTMRTPATLAEFTDRVRAPKLQGLFARGISAICLRRVPPAAAAAVPAQAAATTNKWLWPVVMLAALLLAGLWFFNRTKAPVKETMQSAADTASSAIIGDVGLGDFFKTKLPNGVELNIPQFGIENKLLAFIRTRRSLWTIRRGSTSIV